MDDTIRLAARKKPVAGYLQGHLLIATPAVQGDVFQQSVIYLFNHDADGAMGILVNKPLDSVHYADIFGQLNIETSGRIDRLPVVHGGPVEENRGFVLHSDNYDSDATISSGNGLAVTATVSILRDIAQGNGPRRSLLAIGYAGWASGQLEAEIEANNWITVPASESLVFDSDAGMLWGLAAKTLGVDMGRFSSVAGHA